MFWLNTDRWKGIFLLNRRTTIIRLLAFTFTAASPLLLILGRFVYWIVKIYVYDILYITIEPTFLISFLLQITLNFSSTNLEKSIYPNYSFFYFWINICNNWFFYNIIMVSLIKAHLWLFNRWICYFINYRNWARIKL